MITRIYEREYVTIDYDPSVPCLVATNLKFMLFEEFKSHLDFGLDFMKEKIKETGKIMWLPDTRLTGAFDDAGVKWVIEDWTLRALAAGIKHVGFVVAENQWANMGTEEYSEGVKGCEEKEGMTTAFFKDVESAKKWFRDLSK